jgi:hypothetical protein
MNEKVYSNSTLSPWAHKSDEMCGQSNYLSKKVIHAQLSRASPEHRLTVGCGQESSVKPRTTTKYMVYQNSD